MPVPTLLRDTDTKELRRHCERRRQRLIEARDPWLQFSRQVAEELLPSRLPYLVDPHGHQRGGEQNQNIADAVGHLALETSAAGVVSGTMPATSVWFLLAVRGLFDEDDDLRLFLEDAQRRMLALHDQSNAKQVLPECQKEWVAFGTAAAMVVEDDESVYRLDPLSIGEYLIADDARGRVDTCYRDLTMTVAQLADEFGVDRLSVSSKAAYDRGEFDTVVDCRHAIEPDRDGMNPLGEQEDMPWRSVYYEEAAGTDEVLAVRGYHRFPVLVWRWGKVPGCAYGYGRGHDVLPHLRRLRRMLYRFGQAVAFKAEPPLQTPPGLNHHQVKMLPGGKTPVFGQTPVRSLFEVDLELRELAEEIERTRQEIRDTLGATLVASLRQIQRQMTAREADLRTSQDLTEWLPGLYRLHDELLSPYVEWLWDLAAQSGSLPQAPSSLEGQTIDIEFVSPLARKQRQIEADAIVHTVAVAGQISQVRPDVLDNIDFDEAIRTVSEINGAPERILVPVERMRQLREAKAQRDAAQAQAAAAQQGADIAKTAGEAQRAVA